MKVHCFIMIDSMYTPSVWSILINDCSVSQRCFTTRVLSMTLWDLDNSDKLDIMENTSEQSTGARYLNIACDFVGFDFRLVVSQRKLFER